MLKVIWEYFMYIYIKVAVVLKRHNQAKIIKKSVFLFWLFDMSIICQHVHGLELRKHCNSKYYFPVLPYFHAIN